MRMRFVAILRSGFAYCTCTLEHHFVLPCCHFFAVLTRTHPGTHCFNIRQFHFNWVSPQEYRRAKDRDWIVIEPSEGEDYSIGEGMELIATDQRNRTHFQEAGCPSTTEHHQGIVHLLFNAIFGVP